MNKNPEGHRWSRRGFLRGAGLLGMGGTVAALADRPEGNVPAKSGQKPVVAPAYDLERLRQTDPQLIKYQLVSKIHSPRQGLNRLTVDSNNRLFVAADKWIIQVDPDGTRRLEIDAGEKVRCLAVARNGHIYAGLKDRVQIYDGGGSRLNSWEIPGEKPWLTGLALAEGKVFVADATNKVVLVFDSSGKQVGLLGQKNKSQGTEGFMVPSPYFDLKIDSAGLLWVANPGYHRLEAYNPEGKLIKSWGTPSFGISGFCGCCNPSYFTILRDGRFVTSEKGLVRIKVYSPAGEFESVVAGAESFPKYYENPNATPVALDVACDATGSILVADNLAHEIRVYKTKA